MEEEDGKVALVTGASKGIGKACAEALSLAGFRVAIHYRSGAAAAKSLSATLPHSFTLQADLSEEGACEQLIKAVKAKAGRLDVLVNNAGIAVDQILALAKPTDFDLLIATNLKPVFLLSKFGSRLMLRQRGGRIINISSVVGHSGNPGQSMYSATKAAITGFTKSVALELGKANILVNSVAPGFIQTDMTAALEDKAVAALLEKIPLGRLGNATDVAGAVAFLASDAASYITGTTLHVNGGMYAT